MRALSARRGGPKNLNAETAKAEKAAKKTFLSMAVLLRFLHSSFCGFCVQLLHAAAHPHYDA
jgi:hypothetical protein